MRVCVCEKVQECNLQRPIDIKGYTATQLHPMLQTQEHTMRHTHAGANTYVVHKHTHAYTHTSIHNHAHTPRRRGVGLHHVRPEFVDHFRIAQSVQREHSLKVGQRHLWESLGNNGIQPITTPCVRVYVGICVCVCVCRTETPRGSLPG